MHLVGFSLSTKQKIDKRTLRTPKRKTDKSIQSQNAYGYGNTGPIETGPKSHKWNAGNESPGRLADRNWREGGWY